ncbi:MAG: HD family phosphohydrolase [Verrucomicrobiota bacterium JB025]|nr:HDIG domain-containing protein [Verrucomicrobiota bacterium JB025]
MKWALFFAFAVSCGLLVFRTSPNTPFAEDPVRGSLFAIIIAATAIVMFQVSLLESCRRNSRVILVFGGLIGHLVIVRLIMGLANAGHIPELYRFFFVPFALAPMLHSVLLGRSIGAFSTVFVTLIGSLFVPKGDGLVYMILSLVCGVTGTLLANEVRKRIQLLQAGIYVGAVALLLAILLGNLNVAACFGPNAVEHLQLFGSGGAAAFGTAVLTALLISGTLPVFEGFFLLTTDISWLECSDLNHKLLRRMQLEAPGTFHHSLVVAALSEAAAERIGANAPMCRVCSYFHDVGKLKKPEYFIENQSDEVENPHDALTPTMSALIIIAHVKDGIDLAIKNKLNPRVIDVIQQHHGDSLVYFFYRRAQEQKKEELAKVDQRLENPEDLPSIDEKNFRYPGPRPNSRESGIISLADSVESASRSLKKPTPGRIRTLIEDIFRSRLQDGQLDDCPLTVKELAIIKDSFAVTLRSMLHSRIDYPKEEDKSSSKREMSDRDPTQDTRVIPMVKRA